jgi:hypothetical protein
LLTHDVTIDSNPKTTARARQNPVVRVVAGSLALYVVLGTLAPHPSVLSAVAPDSASSSAAAPQEADHRPPARAIEASDSFSKLPSVARVASAHVVLSNMTASAGGKRLALKLEMSRAEAGNLLPQQVSPN